ncbi:hypothetical protein [Actinoplanes regularis]|uniref:Uncharacterized protein n=1 Tax=Actinoplanes regularis TaxID=52697 RepID=A0A238V0T1_9ACTN|nr:hypothetical protein [Actinoplanes regularis]GIE84088.1 hypothetical protein Are01nite_05680 [Actinoplanes regularis]SNR28080.1 hypothetical protein SAMN06264365_101501 [Actinoplanes regularis]
MTITPPRGTGGATRAASRNRRRRPQVPGEPRHAANAPAFEEAPAPWRRADQPGAHSGEGPSGWFTDASAEYRPTAEHGPDPSFRAPSPRAGHGFEPPDGLGAQLYEVMSDSEREAAVAETLLFVRPVFADESPAGSTENILFTGQAEWDAAAERYLAARTVDPVDEEPPDSARDGRREVSPLTETFLFGPPARHAQEPRSPIDGAAETLLFAGLARALATRLEPVEEPGAVAWDGSAHPDDGAAPAEPMNGPGWAEPVSEPAWVEPVSEPAWVEPVSEPAWVEPVSEPAWVEPVGEQGWAEPGSEPAWAEPAAEQGWTAPVDGPGWAVEPRFAAANPAYREVAEIDQRIPEGHLRDWAELDRQPAAPLPADLGWESAQDGQAVRHGRRNRALSTPAADLGMVPERAQSTPVADLGMGAAGLVDVEPVVDRSYPRAAEDIRELDQQQLADGSPELSPERIAKAAAAEAAWKAFAEGEREAGAEIRTGRRAKSRWMTSLTGSQPELEAASPPKRPGFLWPVFLRCLLYLGPLSVAVAGAGALDRVAWPVPAITLLLGWSAAQALTSVGVTVSRRAGPEPAVRLVGAGFAIVTVLWCALVWIAPASLLGPDRLLAASVGAGGLATLATVTAALVSRSEIAVIRWYLPCWLLGGAVLATAAGAGWARYVPVETLLPAMIVAVLVRAFRPAVLLGRECRIPSLTRVERRRGVGYLVIGIAQAISVALLWRAGTAGTSSLAALPLLVSVPMLEALIGWHTGRIDAGLDSTDNPAALDRRIRNVTMITLAGLFPPLAGGGALALAAYQLPYTLASLGSTRNAVLALAAGTLLGGVFAITFLLAARARIGVAATLATIPPLATLALPLLPQPGASPLPTAVAVLAATHVAGLLIVALTAAELRRTP